MSGNAPLVLVMGVAGSGKTTLGRALAERLGLPFLDADDHHPPANRQRMMAGEPLTDADRAPWLARLHDLLLEHQTQGTGAVLACSLLKQRYRHQVTEGLAPVHLFFLRGSQELIGQRLAARKDHFFPPELLTSQFAALEEPAHATVLAIDQPLETLIEQAVEALAA